MKKGLRAVFILIAIAGSASFIIFLLIRFTPHPPVSEMKIARESLSIAAKSRADIYSRMLYDQSKGYYDSAMVNWQNENRKFIYLRDYYKVFAFAELSEKKANQAAGNSLSIASGMQTKVSHKIDSLRRLIIDLNTLFTTYPLTSEVRSRISRGKMLLEEAEIANIAGLYLQANRKLTDSEYLLTESYENANEDLTSYFKAYPLWKKWEKQTIDESRKNRSYSVIIDKYARKCLVYHSGVKIYEFNAELGKNWVGDKRVNGDYATPEGMYKITKKLDNRKTLYYKALLLDYPNDEDRESFRRELASGSLPVSSMIGGLIEIHGNGGKGIDWTEGCIALSDKDMDVVYRITGAGTPVTIIGSADALETIMRR
jgi:hypothetical protein